VILAATNYKTVTRIKDKVVSKKFRHIWFTEKKKYRTRQILHELKTEEIRVACKRAEQGKLLARLRRRESVISDSESHQRVISLGGSDPYKEPFLENKHNMEKGEAKLRGEI